MCDLVLMNVVVHRSRKRMSDPLELELELHVAISHPTWVLKMELGPSAGAVPTLNHCAMSSVPGKTSSP